MDGARVLEAGSGAGRFTEVLCHTGAKVYSFDYSSAVDANALNNGASPNLVLFQGARFAIPFAEAAFEYVISLGVLQHTPRHSTRSNDLDLRERPSVSARSSMASIRV